MVASKPQAQRSQGWFLGAGLVGLTCAAVGFLHILPFSKWNSRHVGGSAGATGMQPVATETPLLGWLSVAQVTTGEVADSYMAPGPGMVAFQVSIGGQLGPLLLRQGDLAQIHVPVKIGRSSEIAWVRSREPMRVLRAQSDSRLATLEVSAEREAELSVMVSLGKPELLIYTSCLGTPIPEAPAEVIQVGLLPPDGREACLPDTATATNILGTFWVEALGHSVEAPILEDAKILEIRNGNFTSLVLEVPNGSRSRLEAIGHEAKLHVIQDVPGAGCGKQRAWLQPGGDLESLSLLDCC